MHLFDTRGLEKPATATVETADGGYRVTVELEDWREVAVVE